MSVLVIAEPGCTAEGDKATTLRLLETAHACGANVWKPGWTSDAVLMCERRHIGVDHPKRAYYEQAYGWLQWPYEWHAEFRDRCHALGMQYAVSVYLPQDVWPVEPYADLFKVSSFENKDMGLIATARATGKRVLVSQGIKNENELDYGFDSVGSDGLLCTSEYPARIRSLALSLIRRYGFGGLSDHSRRLNMGAYAVCHGAQIVETHYRLGSCHPSNPDYAVAFAPDEYQQYIGNIREAEMAGVYDRQARTVAQEWAVPYRAGKA